MFRTIIEASDDGNLLFTRQTNAAIGGNSLQRRRAARDENPPEWRKQDRFIARPGKPIPAHVIAWPNVRNLTPFGNDPVIQQIADENKACALAYACMAYETTREIEERISEIEKYNAQPKPRLRVELVEE